MFGRILCEKRLLGCGLALALLARALVPLSHTHATKPATCESKCASTVILTHNAPPHGHTGGRGCPACFAAFHHSLPALAVDTTLFAHVPSLPSTLVEAGTVAHYVVDRANPPRAPPAALSIA